MNETLPTTTGVTDLMSAALERLPLPLLVTDERRRIYHANQAATQLLGLSRRQVLGIELGTALRIFGREASERIVAMADAALRSNAGEACELEPTAAWRGALEVRVEGLNIAQGDKPAGVMVSLRDVTAQRTRTNELHYQATHDSLTGLINRYEFQQRLVGFLQHHEYTGVSHALCFIDLNQFKSINDRHGHSTGDRLLSELSNYMQSHLRKGDVLGRLGGDEFGLILGSCSGPEAMHVAQSILRAIAAFRFEHSDSAFQIAASIGVTDIGAASRSVQELIDAADMACYAAKQAGVSGQVSHVVHSNQRAAINQLKDYRVRVEAS